MVVIVGQYDMDGWVVWLKWDLETVGQPLEWIFESIRGS